MDLRVKKTERAIRNAFAELVQKKPIEKITVREIAELAEINKTTFYAHYETVYALIDTLEQEAIDEIIERLEQQDHFLTNPRDFVLNLYASMEICRSDNIIYLGFSSQSFIDKLRSAIFAKLAMQNIIAEQYSDVGVLMVFLVSGLIGIQKTMMLDAADPQLEMLITFIENGFHALPSLG